MPFPVDIRFVAEAERQLGVRFPSSYVTRICQSNGGGIQASPEYWFLYPIFDTSDKMRLKRTCNDVVRETKSARQRACFPADAVAIGENGGGDHLVFIPQADNPKLLAHELYWWDQETGDLVLIVDDFADA